MGRSGWFGLKGSKSKIMNQWQKFCHQCRQRMSWMNQEGRHRAAWAAKADSFKHGGIPSSSCIFVSIFDIFLYWGIHIFWIPLQTCIWNLNTCNQRVSLDSSAFTTIGAIWPKTHCALAALVMLMPSPTFPMMMMKIWQKVNWLMILLGKASTEKSVFSR